MGVSKRMMDDKDLVNAVKALARLGYAQDYIADVLHTNMNTVSAIYVAYGIKRASRINNVEEKDPERERRQRINRVLAEAYNEGCTDKQMSVRAGVNTDKVRSWRYTRGLPENPAYTQCPATNCRFHSKECGDERAFGHGCDYALLTGRTRTAQLTKKEMKTVPCKLFETGEREQVHKQILLDGSIPMPRKPRATKYNWEYAESLWAKGFTDEKIAEEIGAAKTTVQAHRAVWGEANLKPPKGSKYDKDSARELFLEGKTNRDISHETGIPMKTVQRWTHKWREEDG